MSENRSRNTAARPQQRPQQRAGQRPGQPGQRRPQARRKRKKGMNIRFVVFLVVLALLAVGGGILVASLMGGDESGDRVDPSAQAQPTAAAVSALDALYEIEPDETDDANAPVISTAQMVQVDDLKVTQGLSAEWLNVLLLGSDQRDPSEPFRTDTMMICSINKTTGEVKLTSMMRDTAIYFDMLGEHSGEYRLNLANYFGGPDLIMRTLNEKLSMNIQHYVMVDFTSFSIIAEKLGGIEIAVSEAERDEINKNAAQQYKLAIKAGIDESELEATNVLLEEAGESVHLNGRQVLAYARIRKLDSDSMRTERQRKVLIGLLDKLRTKNAQEVMSLAMSLGNYVTTNMSIDDILSVALTVVTSDLNVEQLRIPENGTYLLETRNGESMLYDTNWEANTAALHQFIYGNQ